LRMTNDFGADRTTVQQCENALGVPDRSDFAVRSGGLLSA
jgi:hypothetical protein